MTHLTEQQKREAVECMQQKGGAFVRNLAVTWESASPINRNVLEDAFQDHFELYANRHRLTNNTKKLNQ